VIRAFLAAVAAALVSVAPATAALPSATTGPVSAVGASSATVTGTVNPNGSATTWHVEYGKATSYGSKTASKSAGSGTAAVAITGDLTGLAAGTTYHYRVVATNGSGTARGSDGIFSTTAAPAPTVVTGSARSVTLTAAKLKGTVNPNGLATSWYFEYGATTSYGAKTAAKSAGSGRKAVGESASISGLKAGTIYHYRLVATSASGTTAGHDRTFSTAGSPLVRTGTVGAVEASTARPTGTVDARGRHTTWYFEYGESTFYGVKTATKSAGSAFGAKTVTGSISGLRPGTTYHVRLVATNDVGTSRGADVTFTTAGVTIMAETQAAVYGRSVLLSGLVPLKKQGETVTIYAQEYGQGSPRLIGTVATNAVGAWSFAVKPTVMTSYQASWLSGVSQPTVVGVRPAISLKRVSATRFSTHVSGGRSFARRTVKVQRQTKAGSWVTVKQVRLGSRSGAVFRLTLPRGTSRLRIAMSVNQAGAGYLAGFSRTIAVRR
jgi:hypothetical protein